MFNKAKAKLTFSQYDAIQEAKQEYKKKQDYEKMKLALEMWHDYKVDDIAKKYGKSTNIMFQLIIKYRSKYGWFDYKQVPSDKKANQANKE